MPDLDVAQAVDVLADLPTLRTLRLGALVPNTLSRLRQVRWLQLIGIGLREIPEALFELSELETLSLDQNELAAIPSRLLALPRLRSLVLFRNPISHDEVARLRETFPSIAIDHV